MTHVVLPPLVYFAIAFAGVLLIIPFARKLAFKTGFVDRPDNRKRHEEAVPPIGGLVIFPVFIILSLLFADWQGFWPLCLGLTLLLAVGAVDDYKHMRPWPKFIVQVIASAIIVFSGEARIYQVGNLFGFGDIGLDFMSIPLSLLAVVLLVNALNLIDGLDGLAGGYGAVALFWLIFASALTGHWGHVLAMAPLMGGLLAFLAYNLRTPWRKNASVFLGDSGSMALGLALAWFCIDLAQQKHQVLAPISVAWILAYPIIDTGAQFYRRILEGRHPFAPDRGHFHHHIIHADVSVTEATAFILSISFIMGAIGYLGVNFGIPEFILMAGWLGIMILHMALSQKPSIYIAIFQKLSSKHHRNAACG